MMWMIKKNGTEKWVKPTKIHKISNEEKNN